MKYVCRVTCQHKIEGKITFCERGYIFEFAEDPGPRFECLEAKPGATPIDKQYEIDFLKASEDELKEAKWEFKQAYEAIKDAYDIELFKEKGTRKSEIISQILDARFRAVTINKEPTS